MAGIVAKFDVSNPGGKETPGTKKFVQDTPEDGSRPSVGTLYVTKAALEAAGISGGRVKVTVEADNG
jgi:hypothetical protein